VIPRQRIALWIGGALMLVAAFVPPWVYEIDGGPGGPSIEVRYGFLLSPPAPGEVRGGFGYRVFWEIQLLTWCVLAGSTLGAVFALREKQGRIRSAKRKRSARAGDVRAGRR
jgi:hypothetical protein